MLRKLRDVPPTPLFLKFAELCRQICEDLYDELAEEFPEQLPKGLGEPQAPSPSPPHARAQARLQESETQSQDVGGAGDGLASRDTVAVTRETLTMKLPNLRHSKTKEKDW
jgi:hypothetical protein